MSHQDWVGKSVSQQVSKYCLTLYVIDPYSTDSFTNKRFQKSFWIFYILQYVAIFNQTVSRFQLTLLIIAVTFWGCGLHPCNKSRSTALENDVLKVTFDQTLMGEPWLFNPDVLLNKSGNVQLPHLKTKKKKSRIACANMNFFFLCLMFLHGLWLETAPIRYPGSVSGPIPRKTGKKEWSYNAWESCVKAVCFKFIYFSFLFILSFISTQPLPSRRS